MEILFVCAGVPSHIERLYLYDLLRGIQGRCRFTILCFNPVVRPKQSPDLGPGLRRISCVPLRRDHFAYRLVRSLLGGTPIAVQGFRSGEMADALQRTLRGAQFDAVVVEQLAMAQYRSLIKDTPVVLFPVDAVSRLKWQFVVAERNPLKKVAYFADYRLTLAYEHQAYRESDGVLFVSDVDAEYAIAHGQANASRLFVISVGVDLGYFYPQPGANQAAAIVFVGNLESRINEHAVLWFHHNVWSELRKTIPEAMFLVVGHGPGETIRRLALDDDRIVVTGYVSDFRPYVWQSKLFVAPMQLGTGIKTRVLQAMAMGKAIIASPSSTEGIAVQDGKHLVLARTPKEFLEHISALWIDSARRSELGREARLLAETQHSLEAAASRFLDSLRATLSRVR